MVALTRETRAERTSCSEKDKKVGKEFHLTFFSFISKVNRWEMVMADHVYIPSSLAIDEYKRSPSSGPLFFSLLNSFSFLPFSYFPTNSRFYFFHFTRFGMARTDIMSLCVCVWILYLKS